MIFIGTLLKVALAFIRVFRSRFISLLHVRSDQQFQDCPLTILILSPSWKNYLNSSESSLSVLITRIGGVTTKCIRIKFQKVEFEKILVRRGMPSEAFVFLTE